MARTKTRFVCQQCGATTPKWVGHCTGCDGWGTVVEELDVEAPRSGGAAFGALAASKPQRLIEVSGADVARRPSGFGEFDRVLGGGVVPGMLVLVGGDPGIGKSTLLLQSADRIARMGATVLYVTGEESPRQTRMRADRVGADAPNLWLLAETALERIEQQIDALKPDLLVLDSVQTLQTSDLATGPGSVGQLRAVTARLMTLAKSKEIATFLVGHVTKDGAIAGPRVLEHMVDTVLYFEGQRGHPFRILRAVKNRFGSTDEIGAFEMRSGGLAEITNPSALFLAERASGASGAVVAASFEGSRPLLVEVQALVSPTAYGTPRRTAIGVDSGRVALLLAVLEKRAELHIGAADIFVNVAGGRHLDEPAVDLAVITALASSHLNRVIDSQTLVFGEVGLGGEVRAVTGASARLAEARMLGFTRVILPAGNREGIEVPDSVTLVPVSRIEAALDALF
jgi:DNA repair protein RadA/Sms